MKLYDISMELNENIILWPDSIMFEHKFYKENVSYIKMDLHTGTHIDAPKHFIPTGKAIDELKLAKFIGRCQLVEVKDDVISYKTLQKLDITESKLLIKTKNSYSLPNLFCKDYVAIDEGGAEFIVEKGIELVGIDYISIETFTNRNFSVHRMLLSKEVVILEGLNLKNVRPGHYTIIAFPLFIKNAEASPTRAVLLEDQYV